MIYPCKFLSYRCTRMIIDGYLLSLPTSYKTIDGRKTVSSFKISRFQHSSFVGERTSRTPRIRLNMRSTSP